MKLIRFIRTAFAFILLTFGVASFAQASQVANGQAANVAAAIPPNAAMVEMSHVGLSSNTSTATQFISLIGAVAVLLAIGWILRWRKSSLHSQYGFREKAPNKAD